jgi:hypothetical protein
LFELKSGNFIKNEVFSQPDVPTLGEVGDFENVFVKHYKSNKIAGFLNLKI